MLKKGDWMDIKAQTERGVYQKDIAASLSVSPRTVRRALKRGGPPAGKRPRAKWRKLEGYKGLIDRLLAEGVRNGVVIYRILTEHGYTGKYTVVSEWLKPRRPVRESRATVRFETEPGRQLQSDWGEIWTTVAGKRTKVHFIVNTLGYSRRFHVWCTDSEDAEHTYEGMIRAFEHFGGVTKEVLVDNQKAAVIEHRIAERVVFNERFVDLGACCGFVPRACKPARARTKGKDERMVGYVKHNFFERYRLFESFAHMNALAERWLAEEADLRLHGTVKEIVSERFAREAPALGPLPAVRFDTSYLERRVAAWDGYVEVRGNRYSVPDPLRGKLVNVRISLDGVLSVYDEDGVKAAEHRLRPASAGWVTAAAHHEELWRDTLRVERRDLAVYEEVAACSS
jgi:transposase